MTAMQELICRLDKIRPEVPEGVYSLADSLLEKEKQQIIDAREDGFTSEVLRGRPIIENEEYYQTVSK